MFVLLALIAAVARADAPRIGTITVHTVSLFSDDEQTHGRFYRILNRLHTPTGKELVRKFLLFREGDVYDPLRIKESEKNLRKLDFIKSADITVGPEHDGVVDISVDTQDEWTTDPNVDFGHNGRAGTWSMNVTQKDLFGSAAEVSVTGERTVDRTTQALEVLDSAFVRPYWNLATLLAKSSDGSERRIAIEQPFYSIFTPLSFSIAYDDHSLDERIFRAGEIESRFHVLAHAEHAIGGWAFDATPQHSQRLYAGYETDIADFHRVIGTTLLPASRDFRYLVAGYEYTSTTPLKLDYVDHDQRFDDFDLGRRVAVFLGAGNAAKEMRAEASDGVRLGSGRGLFLPSLSYRTRVIAGRTQNAIASADVRLIWKFDLAKPNAFVSRLHFDEGRRLDRDVQFFADTVHGLRAYPAYAISGDRALVFNAEERVFLGRELMQIFAPGLAMFVDSGTASAARLHFGDLKTDAGIGLRIAIPRAESTVIRLDAAYAFNPVGAMHRGWLISLGTSQAF
ncbi:MAG TPA: hypothetical protein VF980_06125 [Thermoanaerobaculia bacterium]